MTIRQATPQDAPQMCDLLNEIILLGGTTAHQNAFDRELMVDTYIDPPGLIACHLFVEDDEIKGFQSLNWGLPARDAIPRDWAAIASFVAVGASAKGIGRQLFKATLAAAQSAGVSTIDATIRADNLAGLRYYARLGFDDYDRLQALPLADGTPVDRIRKKLDIG